MSVKNKRGNNSARKCWVQGLSEILILFNRLKSKQTPCTQEKENQMMKSEMTDLSLK